MDERERAGREAPMAVEELIRRTVQTLPPEATCKDAATLMNDERIGTVVVVDGDYPLGIITDRDLVVRVMAEGRLPDKTQLQEVMSSDPIFLEGDRGMDEVIRTMRNQRIRRLIVVDDQGRLEGLVSSDDLLGVVAGELTDLTEAIEP
jgi:CBS domain-containing protein